MGLATIFVFQINDNTKKPHLFLIKNSKWLSSFSPPIQCLIVKLFSQFWETNKILTFLQEKINYI